MSVNDEIRTILQHGCGTRAVKINQFGQVHTRGCPYGKYTGRWEFAGTVNDILAARKVAA